MAVWFIQEYGDKAINEKKDKKPTKQNISMAPISIQMLAMDMKVYLLCVFYFPLKCDQLTKLLGKAEGYA